MKVGTSHAPSRAALSACAHCMSHMPMDHLEGLELSDLLLVEARAADRRRASLVVPRRVHEMVEDLSKQLVRRCDGERARLGGA